LKFGGLVEAAVVRQQEMLEVAVVVLMLYRFFQRLV